jgi:hypothetical protein
MSPKCSNLDLNCMCGNVQCAMTWIRRQLRRVMPASGSSSTETGMEQQSGAVEHGGGRATAWRRPWGGGSSGRPTWLVGEVHRDADAAVQGRRRTPPRRPWPARRRSSAARWIGWPPLPAPRACTIDIIAVNVNFLQNLVEIRDA